MIGDEKPPGLFDRMVRAMPEGAILRGVLVALLCLSGTIVAFDFRDMAASQAERDRATRTEPMPVERPEPGDQVRPYLPRTMPVGPDRGQPILPGWDGPVEGEAMGEPMRFVAGPDGAISGVGRIGTDTDEALAAFLDSDEAAGARVLHLQSPGGVVDSALAMARRVRAAGLSTRVVDDGYCASACPLVFAGGVTRSAGTDAWLGVHQLYAVSTGAGSNSEAEVASVQHTIAECQTLLADMGVDPAVWVVAMRTPAESLYVLERDEMVEWRMVRSLPDPPRLIGPPAPTIPSIEVAAGDEGAGGAEAETSDTAEGGAGANEDDPVPAG